MPRTTVGEVKKVLLRDYDPKNLPDITQFIGEANFITNDVRDYAQSISVVLEDERLKLIESRLAAFFYKMASDRVLQSKSTLSSAGTFAGQTMMYLESNQYGQAAVLLDKSGYLTFIAKGGDPQSGTAKGMWLGKAPSEKLSIDDQQ